MMGHYSISINRAARLVRIELRGLLTLQDVHDFAVAQANAYRIQFGTRCQHLTLCDVSECNIQVQEVVEAFRTLLRDESLMSKRMAFVTGKSSAKMQIRRLIDRDSCRFFEDAGTAELWLLSDGAADLVGDKSQAVAR
jgi:hypothetical protein